MTPSSLIARFEGCRLQAYPDPASPLARGQGSDGRPWTVGYGCTGPDIGPTTVWTQAQADEALARRVEQLERNMHGIVLVPVEPCQWAALCSLAYNIGVGAFARSTVVRELNAGNTRAAADAFLMWDRAAGAFNLGLHNRRRVERAVFLREDEPTPVA